MNQEDMEHRLEPLTAERLERFWSDAFPINDWWAHLGAIEPDPAAPYDQYIDINRQRVRRIQKSLQLDPATIEAAQAAAPGTRWLVINEHWCGDGAQIMPVLDAVATASAGRITLRGLFRDTNLDLMDHFLTGGGRSIPMTIALNADFEVTASWGPRPLEASELVRRLKSNPETAEHYSAHLHKWYAQDKQVSIQKEIRSYLL
jgi:hypothetical protein